MCHYYLYCFALVVLAVNLSSCVPMKKYKEALYKADLSRASQINSGQRNEQLQEGFQDLRRDTLAYGERYRDLAQKYAQVSKIERTNTAELNEIQAYLAQTEKALAEEREAHAILRQNTDNQQRASLQKQNRMEDEMEDELRGQEKLVKRKEELLAQTREQYEREFKQKEKTHQQALEQKEKRNRQTLEQKEKGYQQTLAQKERTHKQTLEQKERTHKQTLEQKERMYKQTLEQKERMYKQTLEQKERMYKQTVEQKEQKHEQVLEQKEKKYEQALRQKEEELKIKSEALNMVEEQANVGVVAAAAWGGQLEEALQSYQKQDYQINNEQGKTVLVIAEPALFDPIEWTVLPKGEELLGQMAVLLNDHPAKQMLILGHTDNLKLADSSAYRDNWELSVFKAKQIMEILTNDHQVNPKQLVIAGGGEFHAVANNRNFAGRVQNRRTEFLFW